MKILASIISCLLLTVVIPRTTEVENANQQLYISHYENVLGTSLAFKFKGKSEKEAETAEAAALAEINRLSLIFSIYDSSSEFSKWLKHDLNTPVKISAELFEMLSLFEQWKVRSNGAIDASAVVAGNLWANAAKIQVLPTKAELKLAIKEMQKAHYKLDSVNLTATRLSNTPLVMHTFAKSYIVNLACDAALKASKIDAVVVNIGGDLVIKGNIIDVVNVTNPLSNAENDAPIARLRVSNKAIATSGNYRRGNKIGKNWYSHIVNPLTAKPVEGVISATVIANNATDAGALATAFNILSLPQATALAATVNGAAYLIITKNGKKIESKNWNLFIDHTIKDTEPISEPVFNSAEKPWDAKFELAINFQFNRIEGNSHRPFAAIWVEDDKKVAVRNLALWYNKTRWLPDLRNWYKINSVSFKASPDNYASATGATRNPGKYTIKWDGKNDKGEYVKQGNYTIIIETSKEHGSDEIIRQQMEFKKVAKKAVNKGNVEISNVTFDFRKK